ncbi:MAG: hypothetical protein SFU86_10025, partial [Pirellulaceae bacterium]|nr:hypothetical protein [Pirellulaceae bacterium]
RDQTSQGSFVKWHGEGLRYHALRGEVRAMIATAESIAHGVEAGGEERSGEQVGEPGAVAAQAAISPALGNAKMPPTDRDFEIYREVVLGGQSTRHVAGRHGLSQTRVRQLMKRVLEFLMRAVPEKIPEQTKERRLYVAEQLARMHLEHLHHESLAMWEASKKAAGAGGLGKTCYLAAATRIMATLAKVPVHEWPDFAPDPHEYDIAEMDPDGDPRMEYNSYIAELHEHDPDAKRVFDGLFPPVGDCSADGVSRGPIDPTDYYARYFAGMTYDSSKGARSGLASKNSLPAQPDDLPPAKPLPVEAASDRLPLPGGPTDLPRPVRPEASDVPLTRQQRRARERQLRRKLAKRG